MMDKLSKEDVNKIISESMKYNNVNDDNNPVILRFCRKSSLNYYAIFELKELIYLLTNFINLTRDNTSIVLNYYKSIKNYEVYFNLKNKIIYNSYNENYVILDENEYFYTDILMDIIRSLKEFSLLNPDKILILNDNEIILKDNKEYLYFVYILDECKLLIENHIFKKDDIQYIERTNDFDAGLIIRFNEFRMLEKQFNNTDFLNHLKPFFNIKEVITSNLI